MAKVIIETDDPFLDFPALLLVGERIAEIIPMDPMPPCFDPARREVMAAAQNFARAVQVHRAMRREGEGDAASRSGVIPLKPPMPNIVSLNVEREKRR